MTRPGVEVTLGARRLVLPPAALVAGAVLLVVACVATLVTRVLPGLFGFAPPVRLPAVLDVLFLVLACLTVLAALIALNLGVLGRVEALMSDRRLTAVRLVPLGEVLDGPLVLAPNLEADRRPAVLAALRALAGQKGVASVHAAVSGGDRQDGAVDRIFVTTTLPAARLRALARPLACDGVERVSDRARVRLAQGATLGEGTVWVLTWD